MNVAGIDHDLEARKHLWRGLERLTPQQRVAFVNHLAKGTDRHGVCTRVTSKLETVHEAYWDIMLLSVNHGLSLSLACEQLEKWSRRY